MLKCYSLESDKALVQKEIREKFTIACKHKLIFSSLSLDLKLMNQ